MISTDETKMYNEYIQDIYCNQWEYILEKSEIETLDNSVTYKSIYRDMERIENNNYGYGFSQDSDDLEDDFKQKGFYGKGIFDNEQIKGYIYGYAISNDEYEDIGEIDTDSITIHDEEIKNLIDPESLTTNLTKIVNNHYDGMVDKISTNAKVMSLKKKIKNIFTPKNTLYIANFVAERTHRVYVKSLLQSMITDLKAQGIQYIAMDALGDTQKLFYDSSGNFIESRLNMFGLRPILTANTNYSKLAIAEIT